MDFGTNLGSAWDVLGNLGGLLGCLGRVLGVSWRRLRGVLGASWLLELSWDRFGNILCPFWDRFWDRLAIVFGTLLGIVLGLFWISFGIDSNGVRKRGTRNFKVSEGPEWNSEVSDIREVVI